MFASPFCGGKCRSFFTKPTTSMQASVIVFFQLQYTKVENDVIASSLGGKMNAGLNTAGRGDDDVGNVFLHEVLWCGWLTPLAFMFQYITFDNKGKKCYFLLRSIFSILEFFILEGKCLFLYAGIETLLKNPSRMLLLEKNLATLRSSENQLEQVQNPTLNTRNFPRVNIYVSLGRQIRPWVCDSSPLSDS